jgi:ribose 5-phosphate isomerase A
METTVQDPKRSAGRRAAEMVEDGMIVGLGTGSTVFFTLERLGERVAEEGLQISGVPTSRDTEGKARELGIELVGLADVEAIDLTIDGADEIDGAFRMIKGGGGALLREKVVAAMSRREVIVVGADKVVERLGTTFMLPVEVVPFARPAVLRALSGLGCDPIVRQAGPEAPFRTDNGNEIIDCRFADGIGNPESLEAALAAIPGVVESGLFIGLAHVVVIGTADGGCEVRERGS